MKVSILTSSKGWGGIAVHTLGLAEALDRRGHEVSIVELQGDVYRRARLDRDGYIRVIHIDRAPRREHLSWWESFRILRQLKGDVCIFEKGHLDTESWRLDLAARMCFHRYIVIEQSVCAPMPPKSSTRHVKGLLPGLGLWWYQCFLNRRLRSIGPQRIVCASHAIRTRLIEEYRFPPRKTLTIHDGIDPDTFRPNSQSRRAMRAAWGIPQDALIFGAVGRLHKIKGYELALELFRRLIASLPERDVRLVLVGEGPSRAGLNRAVEDARLEGRVTFTGFVERHWEAYCAFDVFIMPSLVEGLPLSLLEAMACGCCPIAMGVGGVPEVITDPSLGSLVPPGDRESFFAAMRSAAHRSAGELSNMAQKARDHVMAHFNGRVQFRKLAELIEMECDGKGERSKGHAARSPAKGKWINGEGVRER